MLRFKGYFRDASSFSPLNRNFLLDLEWSLSCCLGWIPPLYPCAADEPPLGRSREEMNSLPFSEEKLLFLEKQDLAFPKVWNVWREREASVYPLRSCTASPRSSRWMCGRNERNKKSGTKADGEMVGMIHWESRSGNSFVLGIHNFPPGSQIVHPLWRFGMDPGRDSTSSGSEHLLVRFAGARRG